MKKKCMLTGATGYLGSTLAPLLENDYELVKVGQLTLANDVEQADLGDPNHCRRLVSDYKPDLIIHAAFHSDSDYCESKEGTSKWLNVESTHMLSGALSPEGKFVYISSSQVFDGEEAPYNEAAKPSPRNVYGKHKAAAEDIALTRSDALVIRLNSLIGGETEARPGLLTMLQDTLNGGPAEVDDQYTIYPTFIEDAAQAIRFLVREDARGIYHASGCEGGTRYELACKFAEFIGEEFDHLAANPAMRIRAGKARPPTNPMLDTQKLSQLGFPEFKMFGEILEVLAERGVISVSEMVEII